MKKPFLIIVLMTSFCLVQNVSASTVHYQYTATVSLELRGNQLATPEQMFFAPSVLTSGSFDYNSAAPGFPVDSGGTAYAAISNMAGNIDGMAYADPSGGIFALNDGFDINPIDPNDPLTDLFIITAESPAVPNDLNGFSIENSGTTFALVNVRLFWLNQNGGFLDDELLPADLMFQTEIARIAFDFQDINDPNNTHTVFGDPLVLTAAPVPLPAAVWMFMGAVGFLGAAGKSRLRAT